MSTGRVDRVERLFQLLSPLSPRERLELLDACARGDPDLRRELESLLFHHDRETVLDQPPTLASMSLAAESGDALACDDHEVDEQIGPYRLLERLGAGGMGAVYLA